MKKLRSLVTVLTVLFCSAAHSYGADIVVKQVKIKKRNSNVDRLYHLWADCWEYEMTVTTTKDTGNQTIFAFATSITSKTGIIGSTTMDVTITDCNKKNTIKTITLKLNKKGIYEGSITMPSSKKCPQTLTVANINVTSTKKETALFEAELK